MKKTNIIRGMKKGNNKDRFAVISILLFIVICSSFVFAAQSQTFGGGAYTSTFSGDSMNVVGNSLNPQFNNPNFFNVGGFTPTTDYWPKFEKEDCYERNDFIMQIAPGGCSPAVVRSDLLEEQNVPVFCKVMAIQTNPLIDVSKIRSLHFKKDYPLGVSSISYFPARAALRSRDRLISSPIEDNLGYLVIVLKRQDTESEMPEFVEGNVTATIDYDVEGAFGIGNTNFYVSEMNDEEWLRDYREYGFWNGKGYLRADSIEGDRATISIYKDSGQKQSTITLKKGETSRDLYLGGFYCAAGMNVRLDSIGAPVESALLQINNEQIWVSRGDRFLNKKCIINRLDTYSGGGKIEVTCSQAGKFILSLDSGKAELDVRGDVNTYAIGEEVNSDENVWLAYVGQDYDKADIVVLVQDKISNTEISFSDKETYSVIRELMSKTEKVGDKLEDEIENKLETQYKRKLSSTDSKFIKENVNVAILTEISDANFGVILKQSLVVKDKDWSDASEKEKLSKKYYDKAINNYQDLFDFYPNEKRIDRDNEDPYAAVGLFNAASLSKEFEMNEKANEFYTKLLSDYPDSFVANRALQEREMLIKYDTRDSKAVVNVNNDQYFISLLDFEKPKRENVNAVLLINGEEQILGFGDVFELKSGEDEKSKGNIQLKEIKDDQISLEYNPLNTLSEKTSSSVRKTRTLKLGDKNQEVFENILVKLVGINLEKQAKVSITPKSYGPRTETSFNFKIGIEKRAIKLSPEKTQDMISNLDEQLDKWVSINEKLGKVVKGLKTACFATSAMLTVKNLFTGLSGESMARNAVMTGPNGWNDKCKALVEGKEFSSMQECLLDKGLEIKTSVEDYNSMLKLVNGKMEAIQSSADVKKDSDDFLDFEGSVDSNAVRKKFCEDNFKEYYNSHNTDDIILSDGQKVKLGDIISQKKVNDCDVSLSNMRDLYALGELENSAGEDSVAVDVMRAELSRDLLFTYEVNQYDVNYDSLKESVGIFVGDKPAALRLDGDSIVRAPMNTITNTQAKVWKSGGIGDMTGKKVIPYSIPAGATYYDKKAGEEGRTNLLKNVAGKDILILVEKEGNLYAPKKVYQVNGKELTQIDGVEMGANEQSPVLAYLDKRGATKFIEANPKAYQNKIANPSSLKVKYFQRAPYEGLPAETPFDVENGWYVEMTYVLSGFGKPYEESGRAVNYYICNVGPNGRIEFKQSRDDICRYYNGNTADLNFPGMSLTESKRLVSRAQDAVAQASKQSGKDRVIINGQSYGGGIAIGGNEAQCSDFMSPEDCRILFNICDPVMCPSSRCDLGGKFRVDNVVQSGIIGSLTLCLPNLAEGIMIPICLSGVHAGIEGYVSILNSTRACLKESLETGRNIGICDEIKSVYLCEFFWKQAAPFVNVIIPRLIEGMYSQGARGGGEYLTVQTAWDNMQDSIDYFKNDYAVNSMNAFTARSTEEIGSDVCKSFMSVNTPKNFFDTLTEPDSPEQYHAWFSETQLTSATIPATSHYKVYYHIFSGNDRGSYYVVYLKDLPESNYIHSAGTYIVDRGYIDMGGSVDKAKDFSAVSGYKQLCVSLNGQDKCGFGKVSTSYFVNRLSDEYAKEQSSQVDIKKEKECVAGTASLLSFAQPNVQAGAEEIINPELYNSGIIRVCATQNPGRQVDLSGEYDITNSTYDRWKAVGYCDDPKIKCWLDTNSVKDVIRNTGVEEQVIADVDMNIFGEGYWDKNKSETISNDAQKFIDKLEVSNSEIEIENKIASKVELLKKLTNLGVTNRYRARGLYLLGELYNKIARKIGVVELKIETVPVGTSSSTDIPAEADTATIDTGVGDGEGGISGDDSVDGINGDGIVDEIYTLEGNEIYYYGTDMDLHLKEEGENRYTISYKRFFSSYRGLIINGKIDFDEGRMKDENLKKHARILEDDYVFINGKFVLRESSEGLDWIADISLVTANLDNEEVISSTSDGRYTRDGYYIYIDGQRTEYYLFKTYSGYDIYKVGGGIIYASISENRDGSWEIDKNSQQSFPEFLEDRKFSINGNKVSFE